MSLDWESILPKEKDSEIGLSGLGVREHNEARYECLASLKAAEARGEICKPLSVSEISKLLNEEIRIDMSVAYGGMGQSTILGVAATTFLAEAIHRAMTNKGDL